MVGQIRHFVLIPGHIAIVPPTSTRLHSIDYLHWADFSELKEITVSINRFVFLLFYVRIDCFQKISFAVVFGLLVLDPKE